MTDSLPDLTDRQLEFISYLPASTPEIADEMRIEHTSVENHRHRIGRKFDDADTDASLEYDRSANQWYLVGDAAPSVRRLSTQAKQSITRDVNEYRTEMEAAILRRLERREPLRAIPDPEPGTQDLVVAMGDVHVGDSVEANGREVYNPKIAAASVLEVTRKVLVLKERLSPVTEFNDIHVVWTGDMVTGMDVYKGQAFKIKLGLSDQLALAVEVLTHQIDTFSEHFDTVTVSAVPGNHGLDRSSYSSGQANQDLNAYRWVADRLLDAGIDNVDFHISEGEHSINREIRGHNYHLRHGQAEQTHVDATARSQADQRGLLYATDFDIQIRGHYHQERTESVLNAADVFTTPSPKPGDEFAEMIGQPDCSEHRRLAKVWRIDDKRASFGIHTIDDIDLEMDALDVPTIDDIRRRWRTSA